jgi:release factor glutamine methyltransferase
MKNSKTLFQDFVERVTLKESRDEIKSIAYLVFESVFGWSRADVLSEKIVPENLKEEELDRIVQRINHHEPVQYILREAAFYGRIFTVSPAVLIPRPETEELVRMVINFARQTGRANTRIIDIGTGSGCIAVTLALELPNTKIFATDISEDALKVAVHNADKLGAKVEFITHDVIGSELPLTVDIIVSNPPYIAKSERVNMQTNVIGYEPEMALFVDSKDPLLFYKALVSKAKKSLSACGLLAVEVNERYGNEVRQLFQSNSFEDVQVVQDLFGKDRIVKGILYS